MTRAHIQESISRDDLFADAVRFFWETRAEQADSQIERGGSDQGTRSEATGGKHMDGFYTLIHSFLIDLGVPDEDICIRRSELDLPGFFRAEKQWDLVIIRRHPEGRKELVAALELKSQIGPSFGNNINNRTEELVGSAVDLWTAYREGAFRTSPSPWLGCLILLEECEDSKRGIRNREPHFEVFPEFKGASYIERYHQACRRLLRERIYSGVCYITASKDMKGHYTEPDPELSGERFLRSLISHLHTFYPIH